jgi:hypothetical protein
MKLSHVILGAMIAGMAATSVVGQTPVLGSVEAPYANIMGTVHVAGGVYGAGSVAYGPAGTPLVLSGSDFGKPGDRRDVPHVKTPAVSQTVHLAALPWLS